MSPSALHYTIVIERRLDAPPERVFSAWSNATERRAWDLPGEDWETTVHVQDFRIGGRDASRFGPVGDPRYSCDGLYLDIAPNGRIVSAGTTYDGDARMSATLCTIELHPDGDGTFLKVTDQSVYFDEYEDPADREAGWEAILGNLTAYLEGTDVFS